MTEVRQLLASVRYRLKAIGLSGEFALIIPEKDVDTFRYKIEPDDYPTFNIQRDPECLPICSIEGVKVYYEDH